LIHDTIADDALHELRAIPLCVQQASAMHSMLGAARVTHENEVEQTERSARCAPQVAVAHPAERRMSTGFPDLQHHGPRFGRTDTTLR
jgi:hypothetical protein